MAAARVSAVAPSFTDAAAGAASIVAAAVPAPRGLLQRRHRLWVQCFCLYNWLICLLITVLLFAQGFGVIWSSVTADTHFYFGRSPLLGKAPVSGSNDEPYSDRLVACVRRGQAIRPVQLSQLLLLLERQQSTQTKTKKSPVKLPTTNGIDGYRVVSRHSFTMEATEWPGYVRQCNTIALTLDNILTACETLGYNVTRDVLRIVDGVDATTVTVLPDTLPVLISPFWDYGALARYVVPGRDGSACVFRANGVFEDDTQPNVAVLSGIPRPTRETKTAQWLGYPGGVWKNGWYEDPIVKMRWYSDLISTLPQSAFGIGKRAFDLLNGSHEIDCQSQLPYGCGGGTAVWGWGDQLRMEVDLQFMESVMVSNGSRYGLFLFDALHSQTTTSHYSLSKLLSNGSFVVVLAKWMAAMAALSPHGTVGLGAVANSRSFYLLPLVLVPRLKETLQGFFTSGLDFEGDQRALGDAWFEIYPAIGEFVLIYFSLLNTVAKLTRRRMSDALFGPTLLGFGLLHHLRAPMGAWIWFAGAQRATASTKVTEAELRNAGILEFFTSDLALRTNAHVVSLFTVKLAVLALNLVPLLCFSRRTVDDVTVDTKTTRLEEALAMHFNSNAGLGLGGGSESAIARLAPSNMVTAYEVVRAGYIVVGNPAATSGVVLTSIDHWFWLLGTAPLRRVTPLAVKVLVYEIVLETTGDGVATVRTRPRLAFVFDEKLAHVATWRISCHSFR